MKKTFSILLVMIIFMTCSFGALASQDESVGTVEDAYVIDSFTGERIGSVADLHISAEEVGFTYKGLSFLFPVKEIETSQDIVLSTNTYYGERDQLTCCVVEYNDVYCVKISNKGESFCNRKKDCETNFTIIFGKDVEDYLPEVEAFLSDQEDKRSRSIKAANTNLYVLAQNSTVPFVYSAGSSQGWCTASSIGYDYYNVSSMAYTITYNMPSDGVALWYDA